MKRIPEPELMDERQQAAAYADADFAETDDRFVSRFIELFGANLSGTIVDLGCGPGNISIRMAAACQGCQVTGIDGSRAMLDIAHQRAKALPSDTMRPRFIEAMLPFREVPPHNYSAVVSNSLLHHLHDPAVLWKTLRQIAEPGAPVLIVDLRRPATPEAAQQMVDIYAADAPEVLRKDFYNSLLAAFEPAEVEAQLLEAALSNLSVASIGDRHLEVWGHLLSASHQ